jgi:hypothetical protein
VPLFLTLCYCSLHCATVPYIVQRFLTLCHCSLHCAIIPYIVPLFLTSCHCSLYCATVPYIVPLFLTSCHSSLHCATLPYIVPLFLTFLGNWKIKFRVSYHWELIYVFGILFTSWKESNKRHCRRVRQNHLENTATNFYDSP